MPESTFTFRVDDSLKSAFSHAAKQQDRTAAQLLRDFMRHYVFQTHNEKAYDEEGYDAWYRQKVETGLEAYESGHVISHEESKMRRKRRHTIL